VGNHYFVSYSRLDCEEIARRLADKVTGGTPSYPVWLDVRDEQPGSDWDKQIRDAIRECQGLLFLMTPDSVRDYPGCEPEWAWTLKYKKPIIPLRFDANAELPFRLASRQFIDFATGFDEGLARLRDHFKWLTSPAGVLSQLRFRLADAERELPRVREEAERGRPHSDGGVLAERVGVSPRQIRTAVWALERRGLVIVTKERVGWKGAGKIGRLAIRERGYGKYDDLPTAAEVKKGDPWPFPRRWDDWTVARDFEMVRIGMPIMGLVVWTKEARVKYLKRRLDMLALGQQMQAWERLAGRKPPKELAEYMRLTGADQGAES
jgi:TIR domain